MMLSLPGRLFDCCLNSDFVILIESTPTGILKTWFGTFTKRRREKRSRAIPLSLKRKTRKRDKRRKKQKQMPRWSRKMTLKRRRRTTKTLLTGERTETGTWR